MSIIMDKDAVFHLQTRKTSYILAVVGGKYLAHVYWGGRIRTPRSEDALLKRWSCFDVMEPDCGEGIFSLDYLCREYPTGESDYRVPSLLVEFEDGSRETDFLYEKAEVLEGRKKIAGMPCLYTVSEDEAQTLHITLKDEVGGLRLHLYYTVMDELDVITRYVRLENTGDKKVRVNRILSCSVDYEGSDYEWITLPGAWGRERHIQRSRVTRGENRIGSSRGASSHQMNPFMALLSPGAGEQAGEVYGFNLVYSGNFQAGTQVDQVGKLRAFMGMGNEDFSWLLESGESFETPEVVMVYTKEGLGEMSRIFHRVYKKRLLRGVYKEGKRPILVNNWEATYFDFNEEKILTLAKEAADLGIELLVLDDGWFGKREDDTSSLGDWKVNLNKLPGGLKALADEIEKNGVKFGLWFEPEMVSPDSELYRKHPDWCIHAPGRRRSLCRNQLTLDLSRGDVRQYIIKCLDDILSNVKISYVKWDMNRHMSNLGSAMLPPERQRELPHRYMLSLYEIMEEITQKHPDVLFESCSGGGGRFDAGMLYYMPQIWTSDDTDPIERLYIQYGTSLVYPVSAMGAHVSAIPNHQSGRKTPLATRGCVAMSGNLGYELDLGAFTEEEKKEVKQQVQEYKRIRELIFQGELYRLASPFEGNFAAWMICWEDRSGFVASVVQMQAEVNGSIHRVKMEGLDAEADYIDLDTKEIYHGDELMEIGLVVDLHGDYQSRMWKFSRLSREGEQQWQY